MLRDAAQYPAGDLPDSITIKGRGGTDFRPGFAWLHEQGVRPGCCLYLDRHGMRQLPRGRAPISRGLVSSGAAIDTASPGASASTSDQPDTAGRARIILHIRAPARKEAGCAEAG